MEANSTLPALPETIRWNFVPHATGYQVYIDSDLVYESTDGLTQMETSHLQLEIGTHLIFVRAYNAFQYYNSPPLRFSLIEPSFQIEFLDIDNTWENDTTLLIGDPFPCRFPKPLKLAIQSETDIELVQVIWDTKPAPTEIILFEKEPNEQPQTELVLHFDLTAEQGEQDLSFTLRLKDTYFDTFKTITVSLEPIIAEVWDTIPDYGPLSEPMGLAFLDSDTLIVGDAGTNRFIQLSREGEFEDEWVISESYDTASLQDVVVHPVTGDIFYSLLYTTSGKGYIGIQYDDHQYKDFILSNAPIGMAIEGGRLFVSETDDYASVYDLASPTYTELNQFGLGDFKYTAGLVLSEYYILVGDSSAHAVIAFSKADYAPQARITAGLAQPLGLAIDEQNRLYVVSSIDHKIDIYQIDETLETISFTHIQTIGKEGTSASAPGSFLRPTWIELDHEGFIYISDTGNHRIQRLCPID